MDFDLESLRGRKAGLILQEHCRKAAVIIPVIKTENGPEVLFEVRSEKIGRQPGDVCFPGGAMLEGEAPLDAAVRETCEELLISPDQLEMICACDMFHNASTLIYPFAAYLSGYCGTFSSDEVAEVFTVPLEFFVKTEPIVYDARMVKDLDDDFPYGLINRGKDYKWPPRIDKELFWSCGDHTVWGISARIMKGFTDALHIR